MSIDEFADFNEGKLDPKIDSSINSFLSDNPLMIGKPELIVASTWRRTVETAKAINKFWGDGLPILSSALFDEVSSKVVVRPTAKEWEAMRTKGVLEVKKIRSMNNEGKRRRVLEIDRFLENLPYDRILVVSHSYLIGLLNYWFKVAKRNTKSIDENELEKHEIGGVLDGFSATL
jgi:broad specificity phosphatase PhoE